MDSLSVFLRLSLAFAAGMMFWFLEILVMTAYAFMPGKEFRSAIVLTLAPVLFLIGTTILFNKLFKTKGWKASLVNFGLILLMSVVSMGLLSFMASLLVF